MAAAFDAVEPFTIGLEEELMLLDPVTLVPVARAHEIVGRLDDGARFKLELPASQVEISTGVHRDVPSAIGELAAGRERVAGAAEGIATPIVAAVPPVGPVEADLDDGPAYRQTAVEYGAIARAQQVCALQVHVAVGDADRALSVYNALRGYLPALAALAANGPVYAGNVTDLASVRPKLSALLPRQGIPPVLASWDELARELSWAATAGSVPDAQRWWWELRPHPRFGTLELRVPDAQTTIGDAGAIAAVCQALVVTLAEDGERAPDVPAWRLDENRWSACRHGVEGTLADLATGEPRPTRQRLLALLDRLAPAAGRYGADAHLDHARTLVERNGALRQRAVAAESGPEGVARWLADRFLD